MATDISATVKRFFDAYAVRTFDKGEMIVQAEEAPAGVFYLTEGRVNQYDITPGGSEVVVNVFKPGAYFPMSFAMNATPNHYFFQANTKVAARVAPPAEVVQFLKENPEVLFDLLSRVYRGLDGVLRRMAHLMGGDAKSRLLFELLNAAYRFGQQQPDGSIFVAFKENDLATHSGLARETVNRIMQQLKSLGLVTISHTGTTIKSLKELEAELGTGL